MLGVLADVLSRFVPEQRDFLHLSLALADASRLECMFVTAGFHEIQVERLQRDDSIASYDEYWAPIETSKESQPQVYVSLSEINRRAV
jgi:hypothetical protein